MDKVCFFFLMQTFGLECVKKVVSGLQIFLSMHAVSTHLIRFS